MRLHGRGQGNGQRTCVAPAIRRWGSLVEMGRAAVVEFAPMDLELAGRRAVVTGGSRGASGFIRARRWRVGRAQAPRRMANERCVVLDRGPMTPPASTLRSPSKTRSSTVFSTERDDAWKSAARGQKLVDVSAGLLAVVLRAGP